VGTVGWVGYERDVAADADSARSVLSLARVRIVRGVDPGRFWAVWYPSGDTLVEDGANGLVARSVSLPHREKGPVLALESEILWPIHEEQALAGELVFKGPRKRPWELWYAHPLRKALVSYDLRKGTSSEWKFPQGRVETEGLSLLDRPFLDIDVAASGSLAWLALQDRRGLHLVRWDLANDKWQEELLAPVGANPCVWADEGQVHVAASGDKDLLLFAGKPGGRLEGADSGVGAISWQRTRIASAHGGQTECYLFVDAHGVPHVLFWDRQALHLGYCTAGSLTLLGAFPEWEGAPLVSFAASMVVLPDGTVHVVYFNPKSKALEHHWMTENRWQGEAIAQGVQVLCSDMEEMDGRLVVAYIDLDTNGVYVAAREE